MTETTPTPAPTPSDTPGDGTTAATPSPTPAPSPTPTPTPLETSWGDNWRKDYAGEDSKMLARLERYQSPRAVMDALISAQNRISSGELKKALPADAKPEELAAWRSEHGIPEKPEGYFTNLPDGLVIGDDDRPMFDSFAASLHAVNADPQVARAAIGWYNKFVEDQAAKIAEGDATAKQGAEDALRAEWGADYRANVNAMKGFLDTAPKEVAEMIADARGADGTAILNNPGVVKWLVGLAREMNPAATLVPGAPGNAHKGVEDRIAEIEKTMRTNRNEYNRDEKMQAEYRDLIDARTRLKARSVA